MLTLYVLFASLGGALAAVPWNTAADACAALTSLQLENTTITSATHVPARSNVATPGSCQPSATVTSSLCRVQAVVNTTATSAVHFEAWLPDQWFGRFLGLGNGGLGGCIDYSNLDYGTLLHFASVGSDNGHDGENAAVFLKQPEIINDFASRAIHTEVVLGKQIVEAYYNCAPHKSYYLGCSTGGRQGMQSVLRFPEDFDGVLTGSPATDFNHLGGWQAMLGRFVGAPNTGSKAFIPAEIWPVISREILRQCDGLDGVHDGIITNPDECVFRPEALLCMGTNRKHCLTSRQVSALRRIYEPLYGTQGQLLYPRYDPGAEADGNFAAMFSGEIFSVASDWFKFAIFNDTNFSFDNFSIKDVEFADTINTGEIATWDGDLSAFRERGGKLLTFHGRRDQIISSSNSIRMYNLVSSALALPSLDDFYRLFLVPGMNHCGEGPGAWAFGQSGITSNLVNDSTHNALLALVDWVEKERAPDVVVGSVPRTGAAARRAHCRYPHQSVFDGKVFVCQEYGQTP